jgi:tripartite-type tricarboxylate transporter receptor subunit TctC
MHSKTRLCLALTLAACTAGAWAQSYPSKPIRMIVPFPTGGGTDFLARLLAQRMSESWGQQVVVENRPGASMMIGSEIVAKAPADGYTIIMSSINHTINPSLYQRIPYDTVRDFAPVTLVATSPLVLVVHPSLPVRSVKEFIALARTAKGQINYASSGSGGPLHLAGELFKTMAKIEMSHIPYKGSSPAELDLIGGHVHAIFAGPVSSSPHIKTGRMRALGVTSPKRSAAFPELPTIAESGLPGYDAYTWWGVLAPANTPRDIVTKLNAEIARIVALADIKPKLESQGAEPATGTPEQFARQIQGEIAKWAKVVKDANVKVE